MEWRQELEEYRARARSRTRGSQSVRQICKARGVPFSKLRQALYSKKPENDRSGFVDVLKAFLGET
jgi:hypothetical protein